MSVKSDIETIALAAGADVFHYERQALENVAIDEIECGQVVCVLEEISGVTISTDSNGVSDSVAVSVSFIKQVELQDTADTNSTTMDALLGMCRSLITGLVKTGKYQKNISAPANKYNENVNDANYIGWTMNFNLTPIDGYSEC